MNDELSTLNRQIKREFLATAIFLVFLFVFCFIVNCVVRMEVNNRAQLEADKQRQLDDENQRLEAARDQRNAASPLWQEVPDDVRTTYAGWEIMRYEDSPGQISYTPYAGRGSMQEVRVPNARYILINRTSRSVDCSGFPGGGYPRVAIDANGREILRNDRCRSIYYESSKR